VLAIAMALCLSSAAHALAATRLQAMYQDDPHLMADPQGTLAQMRMLGVGVVKVAVRWPLLAPNPRAHKRPRGFRASDPAAYPAPNWRIYDEIVKDAAADGIAVDFDLGEGAPVWATGPGAPSGSPHFNWEPSAREYGQFVRAVATRYNGRYVPRGAATALPRIAYWSIWSEPNLGYALAPQGVPGHLRIENSGRMYRDLLDAGWTALHQTGHGGDTVLIDELGPRGSSYFGVFAAMKPLVFLRALYCVDPHYRQLRGTAAALRGCPTTSAGSRRFRAAHPALFAATGVADHMWARWYRPNVDPQHDPDYSGLPDLPHFERVLDTLQRLYGSTKRFAIYDTEFGYITNPPNDTAPFVDPLTAAYYLNWAEYMSWRDPRMQSFDQFLLDDPGPSKVPYNGWSSGLFTYTGQPKITYRAWRLPLYLPAVSTHPRRSLEVWGCVRPAAFASVDTGALQSAQIQFAPRGSSVFTTVRTVAIKPRAGNCYFDVRVAFPASGTVRLAWQYPALDAQLRNFAAGQSPIIYSRHVHISVG
jgi:hypothetical protein